MNLLAEIKKMRKSLNLTQSQLAKKANVSQSLIAKIESGNLDPAYSNAKKLFDSLRDLEIKGELTANEMLNKKVVTADENDLVVNVIKKMRKFGISQLPVLKNNSPVGVVTETTIIEHLDNDISKLKIRDVMKDCPPIISSTARKSVILDMLKHYSILIVSDKGKLKGIISKSDLLGSY